MSQTYVPKALVRAVTERAAGQCEYCRCLTRFSSDSFAVEHVTPEARGGATEEASLALSCLGCNSIKGTSVTGRDPVTERDVLLFHPREQRWTTHFAWTPDTTEIIGLTATGRATVCACVLTVSGLSISGPLCVNLEFTRPEILFEKATHKTSDKVML